jgi:hypothetical protein
MNQLLETILTDIYRLDPALKADDAAVRELISVLLTEKPLPVPDRAFAERLREALVVKASQSNVVSGSIVSPWWHLYLAPAGAIALLLIILIPQFVTSPTVVTSPESVLPEVVDTANTTETEGDAFQFEAAVDPSEPSSAKSAVTGPAMGGDMSVSEMSPAMPTPMGLLSEHGSFFVSDQLPGQSVFVEYVQVNQPVLLVVYRGSAVIGVSQVVQPQGESTVIIPLTLPSRAAETLTVAAYLDNGDAIFTPGTDMVVLDGAGMPLTQSFLVTTEVR